MSGPENVRYRDVGWRVYVGKNSPGTTELPSNFEPFSHFNELTGEAISAEILNTLDVSYIENQRRIYEQVKSYVDAAADYEPRVNSDLDSAKIRSKKIHLAIREHTSPEQWRHLYAAIIYGKERGVRIVITRIRD